MNISSLANIKGTPPANANELNALLSHSTLVSQDVLSDESFIFPDSKTLELKRKIESIGTPLKDWDISINYGIKTGYNEAFIIDSNKREEILRACDDTRASLDSNGLNERERTEALIKPILRGRDIKRYSYEWAGLWVINTHNGYESEALSFSEISGRFDVSCSADSVSSLTAKQLHNPKISSKILPPKPTPAKNAKIKIPPIDIEQYPALKAYFDKVASEGKKGKGKGFYDRDDKGITPYNLRNCAYLEEFAKPKIVYSEIVREPQFYLDSGEFKFRYFYAEATSFILTAKDGFSQSLEYLLGILHSKLATFAFKSFYAGGGLGESGYRYKKAFLEKLPIPKIDSTKEHAFVKIVKEIIESKKTNKESKELESKLDSMVFTLYGLSEKEIQDIYICNKPPTYSKCEV